MSTKKALCTKQHQFKVSGNTFDALQIDARKQIQLAQRTMAPILKSSTQEYFVYSNFLSFCLRLD